jgi:hypothetical protein
MWKIDRDYICGEGEVSRVGTTGDTHGDGVFEAIEKLPGEAEGLAKIRFRMLDDDREVYYGGWLHDDDECLNQVEASRFGTNDAGAIWIEVKRDGEWKLEIA